MKTTTEPRFTGMNWDPEVETRKQGAQHATLARKVITKGVKTIKCAKVINDAIRLLRAGWEVRLGGAIRIYPCMDKELETMFPAAMTMGDFRRALSDKKAKVTHRGRTVEGSEIAAEAKARNEAYKSGRTEVTPDTIIICPTCGTEIRVGKCIRK